MPYTEEEKKQRHREAQKRWRENNKEQIKKRTKEYYLNNPEKRKECSKRYYEQNKESNHEYYKEYYQNNKEKISKSNKEYFRTPEGKKNHTISTWVNDLGLKESKENLDRIYHLRQTQVLCNACDCVLTRNGDCSSTQACMDHDHITHRFRHIICNSCNSHDNWKKYFC